MYISYQRGSTTIGNGNIVAFMYIYQDDFVTERYTEMYVKTVFLTATVQSLMTNMKKTLKALQLFLKIPPIYAVRHLIKML